LQDHVILSLTIRRRKTTVPWEFCSSSFTNPIALIYIRRQGLHAIKEAQLMTGDLTNIGSLEVVVAAAAAAATAFCRPVAATIKINPNCKVTA
jgi:hypothetical protein